MLDFKELIQTHEDWLIDRVIDHARAKNLLEYTSTLREAWRASIEEFNGPIADALAESGRDETRYAAAATAAITFGVKEAQLHEPRGVTVDLFLSLLKLYRQGYLDLIALKTGPDADHQALADSILNLFDAIELAITRATSQTDPDLVLKNLRETNRTLMNEKNRYVTVFESIAEPAILIDAEQDSVHVNAAGCRIFFGEVTPGACYYGAVQSKRSKVLASEILDHLDDAADRSDQVYLETASGTRTFSTSRQDMLDVSGKFTGQVIILNDVTDYLAAVDAAEEAARAKSAFLDTVSHEIRTPLSGILGLAASINAADLNAGDQSRLSAITASGNTLSELVENILGFSQTEANALQRFDQDFSPRDFVNQIVEALSPAVDAKGLNLTSEVMRDVPDRVRCDVQKLRHILINLVSNAIKFTERGDVALTLDAIPGEDVSLAFSVRDTGVGVPENANEIVFEPFTQIKHDELGDAVSGNGLGLAICKRLAQFLDGQITAKRLPNGSVFDVSIPVAAPTSRQSDRSSPVGLSILVVEDDRTNALVIEGYLSDLGHKSYIVTDIQAAVGLLNSQAIDLVITDNQFGKHSANDLDNAIRKSRETALPVIVASAAPIRQRLVNGPRKRHLIKPFTRSELDSAIRLSLEYTSGAAEDSDGAAQKSASADQQRDDDWSVLTRLLEDLGRDRCNRIVNSYLETAPRLCDSIFRSLATRNMAAATEAAHKLISGSSFLGIAAVESAARELSEHCRSNDTRSANKAARTVLRRVRSSTQDLSRKWQEIQND